MSETTPPETIHRDELAWLAEQFEQARKEAGLSRKETVLEAGYENMAKGVRRLDNIEEGRRKVPDPRVLDRFAHVLDVDMDRIWRTIRERGEERRRKICSQPLPDDWRVRFCAIPAIYPYAEFSDRLSVAEVLLSATRYAEQKDWRVWVCFADGRTIYIKPDGSRQQHFSGPRTRVR